MSLTASKPRYCLSAKVLPLLRLDPALGAILILPS